MSDEIVIKLPEETTPPETSVIDQAIEIVEVATAIAEKIEEAGEGDGEVFEVLSRLDRIEAAIGALFIRLDDLMSTASAPPVVVVEAPEPEVVEEESTIVVADEVEEIAIVEEEVPVAVTPQIKKKKNRYFL